MMSWPDVLGFLRDFRSVLSMKGRLAESRPYSDPPVNMNPIRIEDPFPLCKINGHTIYHNFKDGSLYVKTKGGEFLKVHDTRDGAFCTDGLTTYFSGDLINVPLDGLASSQEL